MGPTAEAEQTAISTFGRTGQKLACSSPITSHKLSTPVRFLSVPSRLLHFTYHLIHAETDGDFAFQAIAYEHIGSFFSGMIRTLS